MGIKRARALKTTAIVGLILLLPIGSTLYFYGKKPSSQKDFAEYALPDFYWIDALSQEKEPLSRLSFLGQVSLIALVPSGGAASFKKLAAKLEALSGERLRRKGKGASFQLIALSSSSLEKLKGWQNFNLGESYREEAKALLPSKMENKTSEPYFILVDPDARVIAAYDPKELDKRGKQHARHWSRMIFNLYLAEYLSKRTFFGPKRT